MRFSKLILASLTLAAVLLASCASAPKAPGPETEDAGPFSVILLIGDGAGLNYWSAAKLAFSDIAVERLPTIGLVGTAPSDGRITDSAAGATAFAAGVKTYQAIAAQMAVSGVDVMIGGGRAHFDPAERRDGEDLLAVLAESYTVADSAPALTALDLSAVDRLAAFIAEESPGPASERPISLADMTDAALELLARDDDGFFLMVEGSQIDWRGHDNASLNGLLGELYDFDRAIRAALAFQQRRPNTLVVVVADHETGGMALHYDDVGIFRPHYTTGGHTAGMVPLFAGGPGAEALGGINENDHIGRILMELIQRDGTTLAP